jgi:DNA-binding Lrp family transcriptional regulator
MTTVDQQQLARHLGISDRRVRQLEAEGIIERLDVEPAKYDLAGNTSRYRMYANRDLNAICREIEDAAERVDDLLERLRAEGDVNKRRRIAEVDGSAIGRLDAAMALSNALAPEHARDMARTFTKLLIGRTISEFFELCRWRLDIPAEDFQAERPQ